MTLTPFDFSPPNADDPSPRIIKFAPARNAGPGALADGASNSLPSFHDRTRRAIEARLASPVRPTTVERLGKTRPEHREARHITIRPTWRDDLAEIIGEIRAAPLSHAVVGVAGFMVGTFGILGLAELAVRL
jgi:hypothetical protein